MWTVDRKYKKINVEKYSRGADKVNQEEKYTIGSIKHLKNSTCNSAVASTILNSHCRAHITSQHNANLMRCLMTESLLLWRKGKKQLIEIVVKRGA